MEIKVLIRKDNLGRLEKNLNMNSSLSWMDVCNMVIVNGLIVKSRYHTKKLVLLKEEDVLYEDLNEDEIFIPVNLSYNQKATLGRWL